ncbi:MAG TPA: hypothetical protein EYP58_01760 [bacterium (Candidatus Stahlbacteria)]|nr:hypothetical protein [Candidatus Stahlbacteria bacterium]
MKVGYYNRFIPFFLGISLVIISCGNDNQPPLVDITNPVDGAVVSGSIDISADVSDNDGIDRVEFYINDSLVATLKKSPYKHHWTTTGLPDSSLHDIYAKAYDLALSEGSSDTVTVTVYNGDSLICGDVFIWNFDPDDVFYDSAIGGSVDCAYWIEQTLADYGYSFVTGNELPADIDSFDLIFVTLGYFRC